MKLFSRNTRSVSLTEAGSEFVQRASAITRDLEQLEQSMLSYNSLLKGTLSLGAITSLGSIDFSNMLF